ncbi:MAG: SUMF1/EgtB/PvdO family nonheme iron enzyme [Candidatus Riflebacteria bacterium]|nr:SUMF1/EgtB/PvdO family nonheme iron enzyme [Candidatus Riflebacteria bacterium]
MSKNTLFHRDTYYNSLMITFFALMATGLALYLTGCSGNGGETGTVATVSQTSAGAKVIGDRVEFDKTYAGLDSIAMLVRVANVPEGFRADVTVPAASGTEKKFTKAGIPGAPLTLAYSGMDLFSVAPFNALRFSVPLPEGAIVEVVDANAQKTVTTDVRAGFVGFRKRFDINGDQQINTSDLAMVMAWIQTSRASDVAVIRSRGLELFPAQVGTLATLPATIGEDLDGDGLVTSADIALTMAWIQCGRVTDATLVYNRGREISTQVATAPVRFPGENVTGVVTGLVEITLPGGVKMSFVSLPAGTFRRALTHSTSEKYLITISKPLLMGMTEVTRDQYRALYVSDPSHFRTSGNLPVECLSWNDSVDFCNALSDQQGLQRCYTRVGTDTTCYPTFNGYRLPTEVEWEYAYRAGTVTDGYWGSDDPSLYAWCDPNANWTTHEVATKLPNAWGLYDMAGNASEWCNDWYQDDFPAMGLTDPTGPATGTQRVQPNNSYRYATWGMYIISGYGVNRHSYDPTATGNGNGVLDGFGLRVVRNSN